MFGTHFHTDCKGCGACKPPWLYPPTFDASRGGLNRGVRRDVVVICLRATLHAPALLPDNTGADRNNLGIEASPIFCGAWMGWGRSGGRRVGGEEGGGWRG